MRLAADLSFARQLASATAGDLATVFGGALGNVLASSSREILGAGPDGAALQAAARQMAEQLRVILSTS